VTASSEPTTTITLTQAELEALDELLTSSAESVLSVDTELAGAEPDPRWTVGGPLDLAHTKIGRALDELQGE
jgi:hypothetical protein